MSEQESKRLIYKEEFGKNLKLATPIMLGQLGQIMVNFADNVMVGRLGPDSLASVSMSMAIFVPFFIVGMGISFALPPLIAEAQGRQNDRRISRYFKHSMVVNLGYALFAIICMKLIIANAYHLGQEQQVVELAIPYLEIAAWSMIPLMLFQTLRTYADGMSETLPAMIALIMGNVINIAANYILIYGNLGAPALGVTGAALGTLISRIIMLFILFGIILKWKDLGRYITQARYFEYQKIIFNKILKLGIPSSLQMFFEVSAFGGAALIMGSLGAESQAAHQIALNLASMTFLICTGIGMAATIRVGNQLGQNNYLGLHRAGISAILQVSLFMFFAAIIFVLGRHLLPLLYLDDPIVIGIAAQLLIMAAIFQIPDGVQVAALGALRGLQDVIVPSYITLIAYWLIGLPFSYMAAKHWGMGPTGVWTGLVLGLSVSAILLSYRFIIKTHPSKVSKKTFHV